VAAVSRPQVIDDEEHERIHDKVAAVDVAKVCVPKISSVALASRVALHAVRP
jgi:hypothetical protein